MALHIPMHPFMYVHIVQNNVDEIQFSCLYQNSISNGFWNVENLYYRTIYRKMSQVVVL